MTSGYPHRSHSPPQLSGEGRSGDTSKYPQWGWDGAAKQMFHIWRQSQVWEQAEGLGKMRGCSLSRSGPHSCPLAQEGSDQEAPDRISLFASRPCLSPSSSRSLCSGHSGPRFAHTPALGVQDAASPPFWQPSLHSPSLLAPHKVLCDRARLAGWWPARWHPGK